MTGDDEWPPEYEYLGRPTSWQRITRVFGDPVPHVHSCPECYDNFHCTSRCTLEPDLEDEGVPRGAFIGCPTCQAKWEAVENALLAGEPRPEPAEPDFTNQLKLALDLGA